MSLSVLLITMLHAMGYSIIWHNNLAIGFIDEDGNVLMD